MSFDFRCSIKFLLAIKLEILVSLHQEMKFDISSCLLSTEIYQENFKTLFNLLRNVVALSSST
jgi:hypothetical protein